MLLSILLQDPITSWSTVADKGLTIATLLTVSVVLWKFASKANERLIKYLTENQEKVVLALQNNTSALEKLEAALETALDKR